MTTAAHTQPKWEMLADALRNEFQEHGGLLSLLCEQQGSLVERDSDAISLRAAAVEEQARTANELRTIRESLVAEMCAEEGLEEPQALSDLLPRMPENARPLLQALMDGLYGLIEKIQKKALQNRMLIARANSVTDRLLCALEPKSHTRTYDAKGAVSLKSNARKGKVRFSA